MAAVFICFSIQRSAIANNAHSVGNQNLVDLLNFRRKQTIKRVVKADLALSSLAALNHSGALL
jgi:hypothetical protein